MRTPYAGKSTARLTARSPGSPRGPLALLDAETGQPIDHVCDACWDESGRGRDRVGGAESGRQTPALTKSLSRMVSSPASGGPSALLDKTKTSARQIARTPHAVRTVTLRDGMWDDARDSMGRYVGSVFVNNARRVQPLCLSD